MEGTGLLKYALNVDSILKQIGNRKIKSIAIKRTPVSALLKGTLNVFSLGKFGKRLNKNFDEIFHLFVELHLDNGKRVIVEKNERINVAFGKRKGDKVEVEQLQSFSAGLTLNGMLEKTRKRMGEEAFFSYNAASNNCQDFILNFLQANGVGTEANYSFVKQNTEQLFKRLPYLQNLAKGVTDVGADVGDKTDDMQRFIAGRGIPQ